MKEKIILYVDAMLYGDSVTKRYLYGILVLTTGSIILSILALIGFGLIYGLSALLVAIADFIWWQSMILTTDDLEKQGDKEKFLQKKEEQKVLRQQEKIEKKQKKKFEKEKKEIEKRQEKIDKELSEVKSGKKEKGQFEVTKEEVKYILKKSRVKKDHREVIIDSCKSLGLEECPAYIWKDRKKYYLLILGDGEPLKLDYPLSYDTVLTHVNGVKAEPQKEYVRFQIPSFLSVVFEPYLPDYYEKRNFDGTGQYKNLYRLGKDMYFTNNSAKNILEITGASFQIEDEVTRESTHGEDFLNVYKANILWRDRVLSSEEYKRSVSELLGNLARADVGFDDFSRILNRMYEYNLITKAYVEFYIQYRKKYRTKKR